MIHAEEELSKRLEVLIEQSKSVVMRDIAHEIAQRLGIADDTAYLYIKRYAYDKFVRIGNIFVRAEFADVLRNVVRHIAESIAERSRTKVASITVNDVLNELCKNRRGAHRRIVSMVLAEMYQVVRHKPPRKFLVRSSGFRVGEKDVELVRKFLCS